MGDNNSTAMVRTDERAALAKPAERWSFDDMWARAEVLAKSGVFGLKEPNAIMGLMLVCDAEGLHPVQAIRRYDIIQGKAALKSDAMLAEFRQRGGSIGWGRHDHECCEATFAAPGLMEPVTVSWTIEDAKRAGLAQKDTWKNYTRAMLRARVISEGVRMAMPEIVVGMYTPEEVSDFDAPRGAAAAVLVDAAPTVPAVPMATPNQLKALGAALTEMGAKDRDAKHAWIVAQVGRPIASSKELTESEASRCIDAARASRAPYHDPETGEVVPDSKSKGREPGSDDDR